MSGNLPEGIAIMVEAMDCREHQLVHSDAAVLAAHSYQILLGMASHTPHPATTLGKHGQHGAITCQQVGLAVGAPNADELACIISLY